MELTVSGDMHQDFELPIKNRSHLALSIKHLTYKDSRLPLAFSQLLGASGALLHQGEDQGYRHAVGWR